jgi:hypothetical protein
MIIPESVKNYVNGLDSQRGIEDPITGEWGHMPFSESERQQAYEYLMGIQDGVKKILEEKPNLFKDVFGDVKRYEPPRITIRVPI